MNLIVICGATATGKSDLAVTLAQEIDAEIINADSMQLYKGMDIGTAKITIDERKGIAHHLMDLLDVTQDANVAWFQETARAAITEIHGRGRNAIVVGGMGRERNLVYDHRLTDFVPQTKIKGSVNREGIRKMTPREWARLQGFPDKFKIVVADAQAYKQFGNSVAVPAIQATGRSLLRALEV